MIHPSELRLGNIVSHTRNLPAEQKYYLVFNILPTDLQLQSTHDRFAVGINDVNPVLLTNNILEKCSFTDLHRQPEPSNQWYHDHVKGFCIVKEMNDKEEWIFKWYVYPTNEFIHLKSVHQLQNLFFTLYEKELQTKLI
ncbi:hypothetical protein [Pedobacter sp.]|jgi:hypothetical protein|uniref:hypothetical protein n=1 Tax=Pedobacter sp. TaxID=1411316 RepID=UPI002BA166D9|nr:hypothetical protein [Pedobacter sp.]HWW39594.1 hypothetical protein [Pedobacter sp.]